MNFEPLNEQDFALVTTAVETADRLYIEKKQEVAAAIGTAGGNVFSGIHFESPVGWATICGEVCAMSCMISAGHRDLHTIVAIWRSQKGDHCVLPPCGRCRELISDLNPEAWVILTKEKSHWDARGIQNLGKVRIGELLPLKPL